MSRSNLSDDSNPIDSNLPKDILIDILSRLPVPSLLRFKSVSKPFKTLITSPSFITTHHYRNFTLNEHLIVHTKRSFDPHHTVTLIIKTNKKRNDRVDLELPNVCQGSNFMRIVGTCNGLVCVSLCGSGSVIVLWNPASKEVRKLAERQVLVPNGKRVCGVFIGFGEVVRTGEYKIVRFLSYKAVKTNVPKVGVVEVYSKTSDVWKEVENPGLKCLINEFSPTAVVSGGVHWLGTRIGGGKGKDRADGKDCIVVFDLGMEVFGDMSLPECNKYAEGYSWQIAVIGESLSILVYPTCGNMSKSIDIWLMKEYGVAESWSKQFSIRPFTGVSKPVGCFKSGELIFENNKEKLFLYDPRTKKFGTLPLCNSKYVYDVHSYAESLVSASVGI